MHQRPAHQLTEAARNVAHEVQLQIAALHCVPVLHTGYNRVCYQTSASAPFRVSIDTNLFMTALDGSAGWGMQTKCIIMSELNFNNYK